MLVTQEFTVKVDNDVILDDLTLEFGPGVHIVMGPNGVGKSTFAHALMGNPNYDISGAVEFNGKDLLAMETYERARAGLFISFQNPTPIEGLSNFQFIKQSLESMNSKNSLGENLKAFKEISEDLGLSENWDKKQLDVEAIKLLVKKLNNFVQQENKTLIIISHYSDLITKLNPQSVTIIGRNKVTQTDDVSIAYDVLENGFSNYV